MTIRTVTYDDATHIVVPIEATQKQIDEGVQVWTDGWSPNRQGTDVCYASMIATAPEFTSLPNPDLDLLDYALNEGFDESRIDQTIDAMRAALKRLKGDV